MCDSVVVCFLRLRVPPETNKGVSPGASDGYKGQVFDSEGDCYVAFRGEQNHEGDVLIVRYEGPKGGPGMKELHRITEIIKGIPGTAVITDGRFSGASGGFSIGYLCPAAAAGGHTALV